ncbi:hypothetical protein EDD18DRAFT_1425322 [Armillaria luteobubalina]|uniref:Uncharacterized protein n=1 Tax=Armillaria luteobubalina TaxID=153913 RepID=A0AA39PLZ3_9AGAR|nr:hypothetical protein EDD18DRAFT_1425322 [Armillaria luteobubalina]
MVSNPEWTHDLYHLPLILLPDTVSDPNTLYCPNTHFDLYPCAPPQPPAHEQCIYTEDALLLEKTSGLYLTALTHIISLPSLTQPLSMLTLHKKLCGGFCEEHVTHVWTATMDAQPIVAKIFDPLYFIDPYKGMDPFPVIDLSVSRKVEAYRWLTPLQGIQVLRCLGLFVSLLPSQGNLMVYVLLLEHVAGQDVHYLVPDSTIHSLCLAYHTTIVNVAVTVFYDIIMCGIKQHDMVPCNLIIWPP